MGQESRHSFTGSSGRLRSRRQPGLGSHSSGDLIGEGFASKLDQLLPEFISCGCRTHGSLLLQGQQGEQDTESEYASEKESYTLQPTLGGGTPLPELISPDSRVKCL